MKYQTLLQQIIRGTLVILLLVGCGAPAATPVSEVPAATSTSVPSTSAPTPKPSAASLFVCARFDADANGEFLGEEEVQGIFAVTVMGQQSQAERISEAAFWHDDLVVSPTGDRIAYTSMREDTNDDGIVLPMFDSDSPVTVYTANLDGSDEIELLSLGKDQGFPSELMWSRDGQQLAIRMSFPLNVLILNADGSNQQQMSLADFTTSEIYGDFSPTFSPDGTQRILANSDGGVVVVSSDKTYSDVQDNPPLTDSPFLSLAWSPDGTRILMASRSKSDEFAPQPPPSTLYAINADGGGNLTQLSALGEFSEMGLASWSPDGKRIAFLAFLEDTDGDGYVDKSRSGDPILFMVNEDGNQKQRLLSDEYQLGCLGW